MQAIRLRKDTKTIRIVNRTGSLRLVKENKSVKVVNRRNNIRLTHTGNPGPTGNTGSIDVGATTTTAPGTLADVVNVGSNTAAVLDFYIPKGDKGDQGETGVSTFVRSHHGSNPNVARPNAIFVEWVGTVAPLNATVEDTWIDVIV